MKPTVEFLAHHDVDPPRVDPTAFRQGWRVRTRLDQLLGDKRIGPDEWRAATEFRAAWSIARERSSRGPRLGIASAEDADTSVVARINAETSIRAVETAIGAVSFGLVVACVVEDLAWPAIGKHLGRHPETVRDWTVTAIRVLAAAWGRPGRALGVPPTRRTPERPTASTGLPGARARGMA